MPTTKDVHQVREQAEATVNATLDAVRPPLLAVIGAANTAAHAISDTVDKARHPAELADASQDRLQRALGDLQERVSDLPNELRQLRTRMEPAELRRLAETYGQTVTKTYHELVERGAVVFTVDTKPVVKRAFDSVESGVDTAQVRLESAVSDVNVLVDDLRTRFGLAAKVAGEQVDETVSGTAEPAAKQTPATRKTAEGPPSQRKPAARRTGGSASKS